MPRKTKTRAELEAELRWYRRQDNASNVAAVLNNAIRWGGVVACACFGYLSIQSLAGQATSANIGLDLVADVRLSEVFAYIFGGGGVAYGIRQRKLRGDTVERLQDRVRSLERQFDPNRTSSGLTERGDTNPQDE
jgi:hypothetical protein